MFNSVNNPFNRPIESSTSSDKNKQQHQQEKKEQEKKYLEQDEVRLGGMPVLEEDEIKFMVKNYINNLIQENQDEEKVVKKLEKYLEKFDVKKFMKKNPNLTSPDFYMVMYNETEGLVK